MEEPINLIRFRYIICLNDGQVKVLDVYGNKYIILHDFA